MKIKIGTRVRVVKTYNGYAAAIRGRIGTVRDNGSTTSIGVRFLGWKGGHDLNGKGKNKSRRDGWYFDPRDFAIVVRRKKK